jgi:hypothetical protein
MCRSEMGTPKVRVGSTRSDVIPGPALYPPAFERAIAVFVFVVVFLVFLVVDRPLAHRKHYVRPVISPTLHLPILLSGV